MTTILLDYLQIALNVILIVLLVFMASKRFKAEERMKNFLSSFEEIGKEQEKISREFQKNIEEKRQILIELTTKLEDQITEARNIIERLEWLLRKSQEIEREPEFVTKNPEHEQIINLARKGFSPQAIAQHIGKSIGEVELVINLYKALARKKES